MKITLRRTFHRKIAVALLMVFCAELIFPHVALALTSGPTTPETSSFEPIDTTDMVNLQTGDMTYNMPLFEVPGPEGGYPLALSYHAGILPDEDASWVGLGWSLNPGAITRHVNGYPDDWYSQQQTVRDYWSGGSTTTYGVGVSVGLPGPIGNVGFGLDFSQDTYRGFGVGASLSANIYRNGPISIGATVGVSPYGDTYLNVGVGLGYMAASGITGGANIGFSVSSQGIQAGVSGGIGYASPANDQNQRIAGSLLGASLSTKGGSPSFQMGGITASAYNANAGRIETKSNGFSFGFPVWYGINVQLSYSKTRYWSDETVNSTTHGSIHASGWSVSDNRSYDTYSLLADYGESTMIRQPDPARVSGGAFPDFDAYSVYAQGLGGNIRPYLLQGEVMSQNKKNTNGTASVRYYSPGVTNSKPEFRFVSDFTNSYRQQYPVNSPSSNLTSVAPTFDGNPEYGNNDGTYGYVGSGNKLAGSKHIENYGIGHTPIKPRNTKGYNANWVKNIDASGLSNVATIRSYMIEGFTITNESGVTYHFSLPAYSYREEIYQEKIDQNSLSFNRQTKNEPYAYTWHLTAITGPDYVDRNNNKIVDEDDWGYWISFEYGKFTDDYIWRNPGSGYNQDEDSDFRAMSIGTKQIYYLNAIRSRSHIAIFEKDFRIDAKSSATENYRKSTSSRGPSYLYGGLYNQTSRHSMKLDKIYLFNAADSTLIKPTEGGTYTPRTSACANCEFPLHVIDRADVDYVGRSTVEHKALRIIDFVSDYSLTKGTPNSFDSNAPDLKRGKLTLKSVVTRGKGGANILPATEFSYDYDEEDALIRNVGMGYSMMMVEGPPVYAVGDLIEDYETGIFLGYIESVHTELPPQTYYKLVGGSTLTSAVKKVRRTKNPPYRANAKDIWGYYKSDYNQNIVTNNYNIAKQTTYHSSKSVDVWSLRTVRNSMGSKVDVEYESDDYSEIAFGKLSSAFMRNVSFGDNEIINFTLDHEGFSSNELPQIGSEYPAVLALGYETSSSTQSSTGKVLNTRLQILSKNNNSYSAKSTNSMKFYSCCRPTEGTGNISIISRRSNVGAGYRVKSIEVKDIQDQILSTTYNYTSNDDISSGFMSYDPSITPQYDKSYVFPYTWLESAFKAALSYDNQKIYTLARDIPPPAVMYEKVRVSTQRVNATKQVIQREGFVEYEFEKLRSNMVGRVTQSAQSSGNKVVRNHMLKKFLTGIGSLKSMRTYDESGKLIHEIVNHYLHDGLEDNTLSNFMNNYEQRLSRYNYQGVVKERVNEVKTVYHQNTDTIYSVFSSREDLPNIQTGTTTTDFITGIVTKSEVKGFDFYSGNVTKTVNIDAYGNRFLTEDIPAYRKYAEMGLKLSSSTNKNMLSQSAGKVIYKVDAAGTKVAVLGGSSVTWSNALPVLTATGTQVVQNNTANGNVWRMADSYEWTPIVARNDGLTDLNNFADFNWSQPAESHVNWRKNAGITLYNVYSKSLEDIDINGIYAASRLGYKNSKVVTSGGPAKFSEIVYSGAEDETLQTGNLMDVLKGAGTISNTHSHTGTKSLRLSSGQSGFEYTQPVSNLTAGRNYIASVWVRSIGSNSNLKLYYQINGGTPVPSAASSLSSKRAGDWVLVTLVINGNDLQAGKTLKVGVKNDHASEVFVDDFRFQPLDAVTTAYVYDSHTGELSFVLDNNNLFTKYEYDALGRLIGTFKEQLGHTNGSFRTGAFQYNYGLKPYDFGDQTRFAVYARLELSNYTDEGNGNSNTEGYSRRLANLWVKFYWDINCMQPAVLPAPLSFNYETSYLSYDEYGSNGGGHTSSTTAQKGVNGILVSANTVVSDQYRYWDSYFNRIIYEGVNYQFEMIGHHAQGSGSYLPLATKY